MKALEEFSTEEVGMWLVSIGLGKKVEGFQENAVDGKLLVELSDEDLKGDLGLSGLQAKKVTTSIEAFRELTSGGGGGGADDEQIAQLYQQVETLQAENASLKQEIARLKTAAAAANPPPPPSKPAPAPAPAPAKSKPVGHPVIRETGRGAARGAILGAVGGAIAGDAAQGAKMGAAMGATGGALRGVGARRRGRFR